MIGSATFRLPSTRYSLFTGKGGVGKTSLACATGLAFAQQGYLTLVISTDPASNLDEVFGEALGAQPTEVRVIPNLYAMNIDPVAAADRYRERAVGPYRGKLPEAAIRSMEESLSGGCTTEIAAFDEFTELLAGAMANRFERVIFDTAPTGHTLRLLSLPAAWTGFIETNTSGTSCLGPLAALQKQEEIYRSSVEVLKDPSRTTIVLVARPDRTSLVEAARASRELAKLGVSNQHLILNGVFDGQGSTDEIAIAMTQRQSAATAELPVDLVGIPGSVVPLLPRTIVDLQGLRALLAPPDRTPVNSTPVSCRDEDSTLSGLADEIVKAGRGVVMTVGKGGVGKTTIASAIAREIARRGFRTLLTTTDPAGQFVLGKGADNDLTIERIDPKVEVQRYTDFILSTAGRDLDAEGRDLLAEDLRSPCTEEIAVFRAFANAVERANEGFVVIDTAPTGHTVLLLDSAEAYHREVLRATSETPASVVSLLPRLRDPEFTKVIVVTLPEPTPVHEAQALASDLHRAGIEPFAVVVNQSLAASGTSDPHLSAKAAQELDSIAEARGIAPLIAVIPWSAD